ncbi:MAG TPA: hypothetical protein VHP61_01535 [Acidobacteriota bacterium]|nr:hypothetical protein [Acidobacteriota bacterium]
MSPYLIKTFFAVPLVAAGIAAFASQMALMGRAELKGDPEKLRRLHRNAGRAFIVLLLPLAFLGARFWVAAGDSLSIRAGFHVVLALALVILVLIKFLIVRVYRSFLRFAPTLGMTIFALTLLVFALSAVFAGLALISG